MLAEEKVSEAQQAYETALGVTKELESHLHNSEAEYEEKEKSYRMQMMSIAEELRYVFTYFLLEHVMTKWPY